MTDFHNISFPLSLAFGASGGPSRKIEVTQLASGAEHRNAPHARSRRKYNAGAGIKSIDELYDLIAFFEARFGKLHGFRFRDPLDFKSCKPNDDPSVLNQIIGMGDGEKVSFQLLKTYSDTENSYERIITKPILGTVKLAINGSEILAPDYIINDLTGGVTFDIAPPAQSVVTAGFEFDVPVRFDTEALDVALEAFGAGQAVQIPLIEVLDHA